MFGMREWVRGEIAVLDERLEGLRVVASRQFGTIVGLFHEAEDRANERHHAAARERAELRVLLVEAGSKLDRLLEQGTRAGNERKVLRQHVRSGVPVVEIPAPPQPTTVDTPFVIGPELDEKPTIMQTMPGARRKQDAGIPELVLGSSAAPLPRGVVPVVSRLPESSDGTWSVSRAAKELGIAYSTMASYAHVIEGAEKVHGKWVLPIAATKAWAKARA